MSKTAQKNPTRPLSPFMYYRKGYTMTLSILHRITGVALTVGSILLVYWLVAAASGPGNYAQAQEVFTNVLVRILLVAWMFSFCYHLLNGIRHLVWDTGRGFDLKVARYSGYTVAIGAILLTAIIAYLFLAQSNGATL